VSRRFVEATTAALDALMNKSIAELDLQALMIDGIVVGAHTVLIALGIDRTGDKHILGLWEGATENAETCKSLLMSLVDRGLPTNRSILVVIDGSKALAKAVRDVFGKRALIQRCQVHKKRNVLEHLPERERKSIGGAISFAYRCRDAQRAMQLLTNIARRIERKHPGAAASLREGLEETLTVLRFDLPEALEKTLSTTNPIENVNGTVRRVSHNVKRWQDGTMVLRWLAAAIGDAEKGFRRLKGYKGMQKLIDALRTHDAKLDEGLAPIKRAA
jgi:transposase-like protein